MAKYNHKQVELKWQHKWIKEKIYEPNLDKAKKPFYNLMMFPYPSAEGLHIGNMYAFVHSDAYGRFKRLEGYDVFEPIGLDGFGIHSENYAISIGEHIKDVSARTEKHFYKQLHMIGNGYDWSRTVETYKPNYYKWTQWLFLKMYEKGLVYRKSAPVNWCPSCKTVLSDEQVVGGECERCGAVTKKKEMEQWFWRITDYAERLLKNLAWIDWSEEVKTIQKNWLGKSEGINIEYEIKGLDRKISVFTTRPDTNFGATFVVMAPDCDFVEKNIELFPNKKDVLKYVRETKNKSEIERIAEGRKKTGVFTGLYAINNLNNKEMPIYASDFVLATVGTGMVVGVPGHDTRDFEFAQEMGLEIIRVVVGPDGDKSPITRREQVQEEAGTMINSGFLNGMDILKATKKIKDYIEAKGWGRRTVSYKLRDWCVSRQRYWGPPIPMIECQKCGWSPVPEKDLPVLLPEMEDFLPDGTGKGPLNKVKEFVNTTCPKCGGPAKRETDVSDPFVDSCWYYMRYLCTEFEDKALDKKRLKKWLPIDMYIGGKEHSVLHLLYSRFVNMVMHELGYLPLEEPFKKFRAHGLLIKDGAKMSKSKGNIINPDEYIERFGADAVRLYLMFLGDMRQGGDWRDDGMRGMYRFIQRIWHAQEKIKAKTSLGTLLHKTVKGVKEDLENLKYNTAIAKLMVLVNKIYEAGCAKEEFGKFAIILAPFAPHLAEELWAKLGHHRQSGTSRKSIFKEKWPEYDKKLIKDETINLVIQVNSKVRDTIEVSADISEAEAKKLVLESERIKKWIGDNEVKKMIFVKGRLVNIVV